MGRAELADLLDREAVRRPECRTVFEKAARVIETAAGINAILRQRGLL